MSGEAVGKHRTAADDAIASGDPDAIKRLYVDLGDDLWSQHGEDPSQMPLFSLAGTHPVVAAELADVRGAILDAGCGPNPALSIALADDTRRSVVSLDIGHGTVRSALAVAAQRDVRLLGIVGDVEALPFRSGAFDGIACDDTIEHLPDDTAGATELARVAKTEAPIAIATPNRRSLGVLRRKVADRVRGRRRPASDYFVSNSHLREYTWRELEDLTDRVIEPETRRGVPFDGRGLDPRAVRFASWMVTRGPFRAVSPMIVLVGRPRR